MTGKFFFAKLFELMDWNIDYRYKLLGKVIHSVEFYSNTLLCALVNMIGTLDFQYSYRMSGEVDVANRVAYFSMKTLKKNERRPPSDG